MLKINSIESRLNYPAMERSVLADWDKDQTFQKMREKNKKGKKFVFLEGPPTANGHPHIGHALTRASKDLFLRYKSMQGLHIFPLIAGWDCHGLPVEIEIEKKLNLNSKRDIEQYGVKEFNKQCKESVFKYRNEWIQMSKRIGFWIDYGNAYATMFDSYIESVWWALKQIWDKDMLVKDYKVVPYCPRCGTPLSSHEVAQGYKEAEDPSIFVKFKILDENAYFLVWTTTPWTLPSNLLLAVKPDIEYAKIKVDDEVYYLAKDLVPKIFEQYEILAVVKGEQLVGKKYERLLNIQTYEASAFFVVPGSFVTTDDGTGIVHIAPAFGIDDFEMGKKYSLPMLNLVSEEGKFKVGPWKDLYVKDADMHIITLLKTENKLWKQGKIKHTYPFCWRCDTPLLYYAFDTWFIKVSKIRESLIRTNQKINWIPEHLKEGRFGNFLSEAKDWALSRDRYWGTPLPVWRCKKNHYKVIGSFEELKRSALNFPAEFEPHRPYVDEIKLSCDECGEEMEREPYTIDGWFDSGSASFAQFHYPFENKDIFLSSFPVDFITEALDQTRGWFYTLHAISNILFENYAFKNVYTLGFVLNKDGEKMSKSRGETQSPMEVFEAVGADALRLYFYSAPMWKDRRVSTDIIREYRSRTLDVLWNVFVFFSNNAALDKFQPEPELRVTNPLDLWIVSRLNSTISDVRNYMDRFEPNRAVNVIEEFIGELSNWYLRRSRRRFWEEEMNEDKRSGYSALYHSLTTLMCLIAPFTPFIAHYIYSLLTEKSVHLEAYPEAEKERINKIQEKEMSVAIRATELGRRARQVANIKLRQPLLKAYIYAKDPENTEILQKLKNIIMEELNVKEIEISNIKTKNYSLKIQPNLKVLGAKYKEKIKDIVLLISQLKDQDTLYTILESEGVLKLGEFALTKEEIIIKKEPLENMVSEGDENVEVTIDTRIDEAIYYEGLARELIRRIQIMRKEMDLKYDELIHTHVVTDDKDIEKAIFTFNQFIKTETLSSVIELSEIQGYSKKWVINDKNVKIIIAKSIDSQFR